MRDVILDAAREREETEAMRRLASYPEWVLFCDLVDQVASAYVHHLVQPLPEDWKSHYLRGQIKGLDEAKTLPLRVIRLYTEKLRAAEQSQPVDNPQETMRLSPEKE